MVGQSSMVKEHKPGKIYKAYVWLSLYDCCYLRAYTWDHLPYIAFLKSFNRTATICSSIRTFFRGSKLLMVAVLWTLAKTANRGSSMDTFQSSCAKWPYTMRILHDTKLQTVAVLWTQLWKSCHKTAHFENSKKCP